MSKQIAPNLTKDVELVPSLGKRRPRNNDSTLFSFRNRGKAQKQKPVKRSHYQKVVVKCRLIKNNRGDVVKALKAHIRYLERSGTGETGGVPGFFNGEGKISKEDFKLEENRFDPHHFRFIISPEKGSELALEDYIKLLMLEAQKKLNLKLQWTGICHYNTENPHAHIFVRGRTPEGEVLYLPKDFIRKDFREICQIQATKQLGYRDERDVLQEREALLRENRFCYLDRRILEEFRANGLVTVTEKGEWRRNKIIRLQHLVSLGLAEELGTNRFKLQEDTESILTKLGRAQALKERLSRAFRGYDPLRAVLVIGEELSPSEGIVGKVLSRGKLSEIGDEEALLIDTTEGKQVLFKINLFSEIEDRTALEGNIVSIKKERSGGADRILERFVKSWGAEFNKEKFLSFAVESGLFKYLEAKHKTSLEEVGNRFSTRVRTLVDLGIAKDLGGGKVELPKEISEPAERLESKLERKKQYSRVNILSKESLASQVSSPGLTWLDLQPDNPNYLGFGAELTIAKRARGERLKELGLNLSNFKDIQLLFYERRKTQAVNFRPSSGSRLSGTVSHYDYGPFGEEILIKTAEGLVALNLEERGQRPAVGQQIEFKVQSGNQNGLPIQTINNVRLSRERELI